MRAGIDTLEQLLDIMDENKINEIKGITSKSIDEVIQIRKQYKSKHFMKKIYIASSWRNIVIVREWAEILRNKGYKIFDFTDEKAHFTFNYKDIPNHENLNIAELLKMDAPQKAYHTDKEGLDWCNICLLLLPSGKSSHMEAGYCKGLGKHLIIYQDGLDLGNSDVMYGMADLISENPTEVLGYIERLEISKIKMQS
jgi:nucleoside 2-deoxyribosyltransferase